MKQCCTFLLLVFFLLSSFADNQQWLRHKADFLQTLKEKGIDEAISFAEEIVKKKDVKDKKSISTETSQFLFYLGSLYLKKNNQSKALLYFNKSLDITELLQMNLNDPLISKISESLGKIYSSANEYHKADYFFNRSLKIKKVNYGDEHPSVANVYIQLGKLHNKSGDYDKARKYYSDALKIKRKHFGEESNEAAEIVAHKAESYMSEKKLSEAENNFLKAMDTFENNSKKSKFALIFCKDSLAYIYKEQNKLNKAAAFYRDVMSLKREAFGENHIQLANTMNNLSAVYIDKGNVMAEKLLLKAFEICKSNKMADKEVKLQILNNLLKYYKKEGYEDKIENINQIIQVIVKGE